MSPHVHHQHVLSLERSPLPAATLPPTHEGLTALAAAVAHVIGVDVGDEGVPGAEVAGGAALPLAGGRLGCFVVVVEVVVLGWE